MPAHKNRLSKMKNIQKISQASSSSTIGPFQQSKIRYIKNSVRLVMLTGVLISVGLYRLYSDPSIETTRQAQRLLQKQQIRIQEQGVRIMKSKYSASPKATTKQSQVN